MKLEEYIKKNLTESAQTLEKTIKECSDEIKEACLEVINLYFKRGGTVFLFGNGGSAADAQHIAGELFSFFRIKRIPLAANALTTDTSVLTSIANDTDYKYIFSRQLEALATPKDLVIAISTSGKSENVIQALKLCKHRNIKSISLTGAKGNMVAKLSDIAIKVPSQEAAHIQEAHAAIGHIICGVVEEVFFGNNDLEI